MDRDSYVKFCQDAYREEFKDRDQFVPKQGFLLTGIVVLAGVVAKISTVDRLPLALHRIDVFFYYVGAIGTLFSLAYAIVRLMFSVCPRTYEQLTALTEFDEWRAQSKTVLQDPAYGYTPDEVEQKLAEATGEALLERMNESTEHNATQNVKRMQQFNLATYAVFAAVAFLSVQMLASLIFSIVLLFVKG